jgi:hypothetical protein
MSDNPPPGEWSYSAAPPAAGRRRTSRWMIVAAVAVAVLLIAPLVTWLAWPSTPSQDQADAASAPKPLLNDKPPTMILNGLQKRSLYPPGYIDYDPSKDTSDSDFEYDPERDYETTSSPPGCEESPLNALQYDFDNTDPERYGRYPITEVMYPVDDPGGSKEDSPGFYVSIYPAKNPTTLDEFRQWYERCQNAQVTTTVTKHGQVIEQTTSTQDVGYTDAPISAADDSFALTKAGKDICTFIGLVRGMIVDVSCRTSQEEAGAQLFRTVVQRVHDI